MDSWREIVNLTEGLLTSVGDSVTKAVDCIRAARHPGRVVMERKEITSNTYGVEVLPTSLTTLLLDRAVNGVPSFFVTPPIRTEKTDRMHDSANLKADEVRRTIYVEVISGKTLITSSQYREQKLHSLPCSPLARVPKYDAAGIERPTGRVIRNHSYPQGLSINDFASLPTSIEIVLPRIQEIIKDVLHYQQLYPEAAILLTKRDISGAFEWNGFSSEVVQYFGSFVGDPDQAGFGDSMAFPMRSTFGYLHSPAEWHIISAAIDTITSAIHLPVPGRDGVGEIAIRSYVDDAMIVCPDVGLRPWLVVQEIERVITGLLGPGALNEKKLAEEGQWDTQAIFIGFSLCTVTNTISLGAEKLRKARAYLAEPKFNWGYKEVTVHDLQVLLGRLYHWSVVVRPAYAFMAGLLRMISKGGPLITPGFAEDTVEQAWARFWSDIECLRKILEDFGLVRISITAPFVTVLPPPERRRRALLGDDFIVIGTDATEWSTAAVYFTIGEGVRIQLPPSIPEAIRRASAQVGTKAKKGEAICMAITELLAVVSGLLQWENHFVNRLVVMVTDNQNVLTWVRTKGARNLFAQALLRLITRMEVRGKYQVWAEDVRSKDNLMPDCLSRRHNREGVEDAVEVRRWSKIQEGVGIRVTIQPPTFTFPNSWFEAVEPHRWVMRLPCESFREFHSWNPTQPNPIVDTGVPTVRVKLPRCGGGSLQGIALQNHLLEVEQAVAQVENAILAPRTKAKYARDLKAWSDYQDLTGSPHVLIEGNTAETIEHLRGFIGYQGVVRGLKHTTIAGHLSAVRSHHLALGYHDPTSHARVRGMLKGLKRMQGAMESKRPVTKEMLLHIRSNLDLESTNHIYLWAALLTGYMFLLRASEYLGEAVEIWDEAKVLRRRDVRWKRKGRYVEDFTVAEEVQITIRASKTDQYKEGARRSLTVSGRTLCVVQALQALYKATPRMVDSAPLFSSQGCGMITRGFISEVLKSAAKDLGYPTTGLSSHSLRGGGATALWNAGRSAEEICYLGRWKSDSWKIYTHMTAQRLAGVSADIASATYTLAVDKEDARNIREAGFASMTVGPPMGSRWLDREEDIEFVILNTYLSNTHQALVTQYLTRTTWDRLPQRDRRPDRVDQICEQVLRYQEQVYVSELVEVEGWLSSAGLPTLIR